MSVILTQEVEGLKVSDTYTGADEAWLLASGYAKEPALGELQTVTAGGAGLTSFTLTHSGQTTGAIAAAATGATVQTALEALSNLAPGDVVVTGSASGPWLVRFNGAHALLTATPTGGSGTVVVASVGDGVFSGPGVSNTGAADTTIANNREFNPVSHQIAKTSNLPAGSENDGIVLEDADAPTIAYAGPNGNHNYDGSQFTGFANDPASFPLEVTSVTPATGAAAGGVVVKIRGFGFKKITGATGVKFGGTDATAYTVVDDKHLTATAPAHSAGVVDLVLTRPGGGASNTVTKTGAFTYTA